MCARSCGSTLAKTRNHLEGLGPAALGEALGELLSRRLDARLQPLDDTSAGRLLELLYLQASDELWGEHLENCHQLVVSVSLAALDLRGALVECVMRCSDAYEAFRRDADAEAVRRMLRFDAQMAFAGEEPPPTVPDDLELIVGGQPDARPLRPPSNSSTNSD